MIRPKLKLRLSATFAFALLMLSGNIMASIIQHQVLCRIQPGSDIDTVASLINGEVIEAIEESKIYLMILQDTTASVENAILRMQDMPQVITAQPNYVYSNVDPFQISQPFVDFTADPFRENEQPSGYYEQYSRSTLGINTAHEISRGDNITVAIIDGGLNNLHPLFAENLHSASYDFINNNGSPWVFGTDIGNHGTFVAGTVLLAAPETSLMIIRGFNYSARSNSFIIAKCINHAVANGADIINMSFGTDIYDEIIAIALDNACDNDIVLVSAAGNGNELIDKFPGSHLCVINIAAVDTLNRKAEFSNYGITVACTAPGVNIYGPLAGEYQWGLWSGTSFAAPLVSGLAALIKQSYPEKTSEEIISKILENLSELDEPNDMYSINLGEGQINFIESTYISGDANCNRLVDLGDVVYIINYIYKFGPPPLVNNSADNNCDLDINVGDAVYLIAYIFKSGPPPGCND